MRKSIATVCLSGTLREKLLACSAAGFDGVEIFENDLVVSPDDPATISRLAADLGLTIDLYQPFRDFEGVSADRLKQNLKRAAAKFTLMNSLGADLILACSNVATATIADDGLAAEQLHGLAELAADHGIRVAYEALAWGKYVSDFEHAHRIVELAGHPALGTCLDSFHILSRNWDPQPIERLDPAKIFFCQLADATRLSMDILSWSRHHRVFPGEGGWDIPGFMTHIVRSGYTGTVSLEVFNDVFRQSPADHTALDGMRSLIWLEDQTARRLDEDDTTSERHGGSDRMTVTALPHAGQPTGINFAEVTTANPAEMEAMLSQLGFQFGGRHRTKPVQLWAHGTARIILNEQQPIGGGPTISAIGFDMTDPAIALSRAQLLKAVLVPRQTNANEENLQAIESPDSTEVFLCQGSPDGAAAWTAEFGTNGSTSERLTEERTGGITHIDHINLSQPWQHFDETVLFYESMLSLSAQPSSEVSAPSGLVRSQVLRSGDGTVRLALNIAPLALEGSGSSAAAIYPEHVAFATDDLVAIARRARAQGLEFLPVPQNYYEDLQARLDIEPSLLATLQELNLLYDQDECGEFLHFYTRTIGTVFFEVVERRRGYDGYGAPNAPVRLASQYERRDGVLS
jgi:4-hydroxyphenylpyruvate dioxygenase